MNLTIPKHTMLFLRILVSVSLVYLIFTKIPFASIPNFFQSFSLQTLAIVFLLQVFSLLLISFRWKLFLPKFSLLKLFRFNLVGQFYSFVLPGQITGEIAKAFRVASGSVGEGGKVTTSIVLDKVVGLIGLLVVTAFGLFFTKIHERSALFIFIFIFLGALVSGLLVLRSNFCFSVINTILKYFEKKFSRLDKVFFFIHDTLQRSNECVEKPALLLYSIFLSVVSQLLSIVITIILALSLGIHIPVLEWFWIFGFVALGVTLPITMLGIGVREGLFVYFLTSFSVEPGVAVALSLSILAIQVIVAVVGGLLELKVYFFNKNK